MKLLIISSLLALLFSVVFIDAAALNDPRYIDNNNLTI